MSYWLIIKLKLKSNVCMFTVFDVLILIRHKKMELERVVGQKWLSSATVAFQGSGWHVEMESCFEDTILLLTIFALNFFSNAFLPSCSHSASRRPIIVAYVCLQFSLIYHLRFSSKLNNQNQVAKCLAHSWCPINIWCVEGQLRNNYLHLKRRKCSKVACWSVQVFRLLKQYILKSLESASHPLLF